MKLTKTEKIIYKAALEGHSTYNSLSKATGRSVRTLKFHLTNLYKKTGKNSLLQLCGLEEGNKTSPCLSYTWREGMQCDCRLSSEYKTPEDVPERILYDLDLPGEFTPVPVDGQTNCAFCGYAAQYVKERTL